MHHGTMVSITLPWSAAHSAMLRLCGMQMSTDTYKFRAQILFGTICHAQNRNSGKSGYATKLVECYEKCR